MIMEFSTTGISRVVASAGAEFVVFDMEHTGWSMETIRMLIATCRSTTMVPLVRVADTHYHLMARPLDMGAMGLMVPMVENAEQARLIVQSVKYPPVGRRGIGICPPHPHYDTPGDQPSKIRNVNEELLIIAQIETAKGVENVDEIAAVDGVDVLWIGHIDLSNSMGIPGQFKSEKYLTAERKVLAACQRQGKAAGMMASSVDEAKALLAKGFRCLAYWNDHKIYQQALQQALKAIRE